MTLVAAQKKGKTISFVSDSRITFGRGHIDFGVKIFSVPVKIESPTDSDSGESTVDYDYKLGLAVTGSAINAYTVKESIYEILQHLQHLPGYTDLSMDGISKLIFKVYKKATLELTAIMEDSGMCGIILGGYCPIQDEIRVFEFYTEELDGLYTPKCQEILVDECIEFYGCGKEQAERVVANNASFSALHIVREVINSKIERKVGGGLQYGEFINRNFKIYGIADYEINSDGTFKDFTFSLRGISVYKDEFERNDDGFHIAYKFIEPFKKETDELLRRQIEGEN